MKRFILTLICAVLTLGVMAQNAKNVLVIDSESFRPEQKGTLKEVNIDPIGIDRSKRKCARLKIRLNRMSREEIAALEVRLPGGLVELMKREVAAEGNGLILELTAKPQTRLYLHHEKYGDSNEVKLNLEGDKVYLLDGQLNYLHSIIVETNTPDVEISIDGSFKGRTDATQKLVIEEVLPGEHTLTAKYGASVKEQRINVNSREFSFTMNVDIAGKLPQFVTFVVSPVTALLKFEGEILPLDEGGAAAKYLSQGVYKWSVEADEFHPQSGTVTVADKDQVKEIKLRPAFGYLSVRGSHIAGAKLYIDNRPITQSLASPIKLASGRHTVQVVKEKFKSYTTEVVIADEQTATITPTLEANFANVTLTAGAGVEIVINNQSKGTERWSGELAIGPYRIECRKAGHRSAEQSLNVTSSASINLRLNDPEPIYGSIQVMSNPLMGKITLDGRTIGETPRRIDNIVVGTHTISISKDGYSTWSKEISVTEGQTLQLSATLQKIATSSTTTASTTTRTITLSTTPTNKVYKVGDYYNDGKKEGVVFWVDPSGKHGKIVSLTESSSPLQWSSDAAEQKRLIGADDKDDGAKNMAVVKQISDWQSKYPAFKWCADLGEGWYLPAIDELKIFTLDKTVHDAVNKTLKIKGKKLTNRGKYGYYRSSTESNKLYSGEFCAWLVDMYDRDTYRIRKYRSCYVRAVAAVTFGESESKTTSSASATPAIQVASSKTYKVGDYYNDGKKEGVVFWVDETGQHGKIVSLTESRSLQWSSSKKEQRRLIGADDKDDGAKNMAVVKQIRDWESKYPAFKWCADLGEGWYLPAIDELKIFTLDNTVYDAVNQTLKTKGKKLADKGYYRWYWSSTERNRKYKGKFCAWLVNMGDVDTSNHIKDFDVYVRAVAAVTFGESTPQTPTVTNGKIYKVGDYYNDGKKEGVVFWVDETGQHGKIVSLTESYKGWSSNKKEQRRLIGADDKDDGAKNMAVVKQRPDWQSKYPAFKWCADWGEGWYLPAIDELKIFTLDNTVYDAVNQTLEPKGEKLANKGGSRWYWSSTERNRKYKGKFCARIVSMRGGYTSSLNKGNSIYVRAVSAF